MVLVRHLLGGVLRRQRLRQGLTLREVSVDARVSLGYISEVERGQKEASSELLAAICGALEVPLSDILREVSDEIDKIEAPVLTPAAGRQAISNVASRQVEPGSVDTRQIDASRVDAHPVDALDAHRVGAGHIDSRHIDSRQIGARRIDKARIQSSRISRATVDSARIELPLLERGQLEPAPLEVTPVEADDAGRVVVAA